MISIATSWRRGMVFAVALGAATLALAQEAAVTKRATELRESPGSGRPLAQLAAQTPVTRLAQRQGAWIQVRTAEGTQGWVHLFDVAPASGAARSEDAGGSGALRGVTNLFTRGTTTNASAGGGIRGLSAEDLARASPNPAAVGQMEGLRQSENDARAFARSAPWQEVAVEPLPEPARPTAGAGNDPSRQ